MCVPDSFKYGLILVEAHAALTVITYFQGLAPFNDSRQLPVFGYAARQDVKERGFPASILADNADSLEPLEIVCESVQIDILAVSETEVLAVDDFAAEAGSLSQGIH